MRDDGHPCDGTPGEGPDGADEADTTASDGAGLAVETIVGLLPQKLRDRIIAPPPIGVRSPDLNYVINSLISRNLDDSTIERMIRRYPQGIVAKYARSTDLHKEIRRIREKASRREAAKADAAEARGSGRPYRAGLG